MMVRMPDSPRCSATIHTVKVPANWTMIALGTLGDARAEQHAESFANNIACDQAAKQRQRDRWGRTADHHEMLGVMARPTAMR